MTLSDLTQVSSATDIATKTAVLVDDPLSQQLAQRFGFVEVLRSVSAAEHIRQLAAQKQVEHVLWYQDHCLYWQALAHTHWKPISGHLTEPAFLRRLKWASKRSEYVLRALGKGARQWTVLDATAGMGIDSVLLATQVHSVIMIERSPVVFALLEDALRRAAAHSILAPLLEKVTCQFGNAIDYLQNLHSDQCPDVVYCDPMFEKPKVAQLARKTMVGLREVVGCDQDSDRLLTLALKQARHRVIYKTYPMQKDELAPGVLRDADICYAANSCQFNVYLTTFCSKATQ